MFGPEAINNSLNWWKRSMNYMGEAKREGTVVCVVRLGRHLSRDQVSRNRAQNYESYFNGFGDKSNENWFFLATFCILSIVTVDLIAGIDSFYAYRQYYYYYYYGNQWRESPPQSCSQNKRKPRRIEDSNHDISLSWYTVIYSRFLSRPLLLECQRFAR